MTDSAHVEAQFSAEALRKQALIDRLKAAGDPVPLSLYVGIFEPATPPAAGQTCRHCGADARPDTAFGGDGVFCSLCMSRGRDAEYRTLADADLDAVRVMQDVASEIVRAAAKHGNQDHLPDGTGPHKQTLVELLVELTTPGGTNASVADAARRRCDAAAEALGDGTVTFEHILTEEWAEAMAESDPDRLRTELVQVAAVAVQWARAIDRRRDGETR